MKKITQIIVLITTFFVSINSFAGVSSIDGYKDITFGMSIDEGYEILKKCKDEGGCKQSITLLSDGTANVTGISVDYGRYNKHLGKKIKKAISKKYNENFTPNECDKNKYGEPVDKWEMLTSYSKNLNNMEDQILRTEQGYPGVKDGGIFGAIIGLTKLNVYIREFGFGFSNNQVWFLLVKKLDMETSLKFNKNPELWSTDDHIVVEYSEKNGIGQKRYEKLMDSQCHQELDV